MVLANCKPIERRRTWRGGARGGIGCGRIREAHVAFLDSAPEGGRLLIRSFGQLLQTDSGSVEELISLWNSPPRATYNPPSALDFFPSSPRSGPATSRVKSAALVRSLPFNGNTAATGSLFSPSAPPQDGPQVLLNLATAAFHATQRPLPSCRLLAQDRANAPPFHYHHTWRVAFAGPTR